MQKGSAVNYLNRLNQQNRVFSDRPPGAAPPKLIKNLADLPGDESGREARQLLSDVLFSLRAGALAKYEDAEAKMYGFAPQLVSMLYAYVPTNEDIETLWSRSASASTSVASNPPSATSPRSSFTGLSMLAT